MINYESRIDMDAIVETGQWYAALAASSNEVFLPLFSDTSRHLVLCGGAGSGKSIFAGRKVLERVSTEADHRILVCRKVARTLRESCFRQLIGQIRTHYNARDYKINRTEMLITYLPNGSQILFAGLDDAEKLKSIYRVTGIWIEEGSELLESDYDQLNIRLRGETATYKQIITTFNPVDINHWLKRRFFSGQLPGVRAHRSTYRDNRFLDDEQKAVLESFRTTDPYYYRVYCLGEWGVFGKTVFSAQGVSERLSALSVAPLHGEFSYTYDGLAVHDIRWQEAEHGSIAVYRMPEDGVPYVIGGDTAGEGSDSFTAHVINNITGEQCAVLCHPYDEDIYAKELYCLGMFYNEALIGIEANTTTYPIRELERLGYRKQYIRETEDNFTHRPKYSYGFRTTALTRPVMIANLVALMREHLELIHDRATLEEMLTFVRSEKGRAEAQNGAHDDLVMALAIAYYIREQQGAALPEPPVHTHYNFACEMPKADVLGVGEAIDII